MSTRELIGALADEIGVSEDTIVDALSSVGAVEIIGGDVEIIGADQDVEDLLKRVGDVDLIGARKNPLREAAMLSTLQKALRDKREREAINRTKAKRFVVRDRVPTEVQEIPLGFGPAIIGAAATQSIEATPQVVFKTKRLIVDNPSVWIIRDVKVGNRSIFAAAGPVLGAAFGADTVGSNLKAETASVNQKIIIEATNRTGAPQEFLAAMFGDAVQ